MEDVFKMIDGMEDYVIETRRTLHRMPELCFDTEKTEIYIKTEIEKLGLKILPSSCGILAMLNCENSHGIIALRSDTDALPIEEKTGLDFSSQNFGKMHACGHDGHITMLLTAMKTLVHFKDRLKHDILFIFQPAEEGPPPYSGAQIMVEDLKRSGMIKKIRSFFGEHVTCSFPTGTIAIRYGEAMASTDLFEITVHGKGGHCGTPHKTIDAISIASKFISNMETIVNKRISPMSNAVFSIGMIEGGDANNIVAQECTMCGTLRCLNKEDREFLKLKVKNLLDGLSMTFDCKYDLKITSGLPPLFNDERKMDITKKIILNNFSEEHLTIMREPMMLAEDFAYFAQAVPSAFVWIGVGNHSKKCVYPLHSPYFNLDETGLLYGAKLHTAFALQYPVTNL